MGPAVVGGGFSLNTGPDDPCETSSWVLAIASPVLPKTAFLSVILFTSMSVAEAAMVWTRLRMRMSAAVNVGSEMAISFPRDQDDA